jgi:hypothetical protein
VTEDISDITQMTVLRCLNSWKSEYVIVINASTSEYSIETVTLEGECSASRQEKLMDLG